MHDELDTDDYKLFAETCESIGLVPSEHQYKKKWQTKSGLAYKAYRGIPDINLKNGKAVNLSGSLPQWQMPPWVPAPQDERIPDFDWKLESKVEPKGGCDCAICRRHYDRLDQEDQETEESILEAQGIPKDWHAQVREFVRRMSQERELPGGMLGMATVDLKSEELSKTPHEFYGQHPLLALQPKTLIGTYYNRSPGNWPDIKIYDTTDANDEPAYYSRSIKEEYNREKLNAEQTAQFVRQLLEKGYDKLDGTTDFFVVCSTKNNKWHEKHTSLKQAMEFAHKMKKYNKCSIGIIETSPEAQKKPIDAFKEAVKAVKKSKRIVGQHKQLPLLKQIAEARLHSFLVGPAGSGKSSAAEQVAKQLNLAFCSQSVCSQTSKSELLGYMDATGKYVGSLFRKIYETGGIYLLDEVDAGNPNVLAVLNSALSNGFCSFPDAMVTMHSDFILIASANTFGTGADRQYVGRNQLDAATLDRFVVIEWNYDGDFEMELAKNDEWTEYVQKVRKIVNDLKIRHVVSPRASIGGAKLLAAGLPRDQVEKMVLWKGIDSDSYKTVKAKLL